MNSASGANGEPEVMLVHKRAVSEKRSSLARTLAISLLVLWPPAAGAAPDPGCVVVSTITVPGKLVKHPKPGQLKRLPDSHAYRLADGTVVFLGNLEVDADGGPHAYHPPPKRGLDRLADGGMPGNWWALATDAKDKHGRLDCGPTGTPIVQGPGDPAPGYYASMTTMNDEKIADCRRQARYVNAELVPYVALPPAIAKFDGKKDRGNRVLVQRGNDANPVGAIFADVAPHYGIGEGSISLAHDLGVDESPTGGGDTSRDLLYVVLPEMLAFPRNADGLGPLTGDLPTGWTKDRLAACRSVVAKLAR